jgi:hypothetical protein
MAVPSMGQNCQEINCLEIDEIPRDMGTFAPNLERFICQKFLQFVKIWSTLLFLINLLDS